MIQLKYGVYTKIQNYFGGDWSAGVLQGRGTSSKDCTRRIGFIGKTADEIATRSAGNYRRG